MEEKTIGAMNEGEFDALVEGFIDRGEDKITPSTFFQSMADIAEQRKQREVELTGALINGEIIFDTPAPVPVEKNALYLGDTKVTFKLRLAA